jgi:hypothetical protein
MDFVLKGKALVTKNNLNTDSIFLAASDRFRR